MTFRARASLIVALAIALALAVALVVWSRSGGTPFSSRSSVPAPGAAEAAKSVAQRPLPTPIRRLPRGCAELCDCCPSGRDCGAGGCDASLAPGRRFTLRPEAASSDGKLRVCLDSGEAEAARQCTGLGGELVVDGDELASAGLVITVELPVATETGVFRKQLVLREEVRGRPLTGLSLCRGVDLERLELPVRGLVIHLDPPSGPPPERCAKQP